MMKATPLPSLVRLRFEPWGHPVHGLCLLGLVALAAGCRSYTVPGSAADLHAFAELQQTGPDESGVDDILERRPTVVFPATLAVARVQAPVNRSAPFRAASDGGSYAVIGVRDIEEEEDFTRLAELPQVTGVAAVNRLLLPAQLRSALDLRQGAALLRADLLLVYTFDTTVAVDDHVNLFEVLTLGLLSHQEARVKTTASALLLDTRSGYLYAIAEGTAAMDESTSVWNAHNTSERLRRASEREALEKLLDEVVGLWTNILEGYGGLEPDEG